MYKNLEFGSGCSNYITKMFHPN